MHRPRLSVGPGLGVRHTRMSLYTSRLSLRLGRTSCLRLWQRRPSTKTSRLPFPSTGVLPGCGQWVKQTLSLGRDGMPQGALEQRAVKERTDVAQQRLCVLLVLGEALGLSHGHAAGFNQQVQ